MESIYSVGVTNRYAMFQDDEDDPGDVVLTPSSRAEPKTEKDKKKAEKAVKGKGKEAKEKAQQLSGKKVAADSSNKRECPRGNAYNMVGCW